MITQDIKATGKETVGGLHLKTKEEIRAKANTKEQTKAKGNGSRLLPGNDQAVGMMTNGTNSVIGTKATRKEPVGVLHPKVKGRRR